MKSSLVVLIIDENLHEKALLDALFNKMGSQGSRPPSCLVLNRVPEVLK